MRYWMCNRILRCVQTFIADSIMKLSGGPLVAVVLLGIIIPITIFTTYLGSVTPLKQADSPAPVSKSLRLSHASLSPWQRHIKQQCLRYDRPTNFDIIDPNLFRHFLVDEKYKLIYCQIPKVATTTWRRIFIILTGKAGTTDMMSLAPNDVHHKHDDLLTYLSDLPEDQIMHRLRTYFKFVFVREPFERILSAFRNKFEARYSPSTYFQKSFGRKIIKRYRTNKSSSLNADETAKITFGEFIDYLVDPKKLIITNEHWQQFHELCLPCAIDYDFIGKLETIEEDSNFLLQKSGLTDVIKFPSRTNANYKTKKTNTLLKDYYSKIPSSKLIKLWGTYKEDFDIFNYTLPDDVTYLLN